MNIDVSNYPLLEVARLLQVRGGRRFGYVNGDAGWIILEENKSLNESKEFSLYLEFESECIENGRFIKKTLKHRLFDFQEDLVEGFKPITAGYRIIFAEAH